MSINSSLCNFLLSDKMNSRNMILSGALIALVMLVTTNVFFTSTALAYIQPGAFNPNGNIQAWEVKKDIQICNQGTSPPQGPSYEIGGCVDVTNDEGRNLVSGNATYVRSGSYLFTGETLNYLAVARDLNGAQFLMPQAQLQIDGVEKVLCTAYSSSEASAIASGSETWYGHDVKGLLAILPPQIGLKDLTGFNPTYDVLYTCTYTVTGQDTDLAGKVVVIASDTSNNQAPTLEETWAFNPGISASVNFDSLGTLTFPSAQPGTTVYSTNSLLIQNTALGGVDLAVFMAGNDLVDTAHSGALCPTSNVLSITNIGYRCNIGSYFSENWTEIPNLKQSAQCGETGVLPETTGEGTNTNIGSQPTCLVDSSWPFSNLLIPDEHSKVSDSILHNGAQAQCTFQLNVPFPCMGTFSSIKALDVLIRAV